MQDDVVNNYHSTRSEDDGSIEPSRRSTAKKIEANRRNAQKSTGPKTERGKAHVRANALRHGFLAKQVMISSKLVGEDSEEFADLLRKLQQHYKPANVAEEMQVEVIAICFWRDRRVLRCEMGEVAILQYNVRQHKILTHDVAAHHGLVGQFVDILREAESQLETKARTFGADEIGVVLAVRSRRAQGTEFCRTQPKQGCASAENPSR